MKFNKIKIVLLLVLPLLGCNTISELRLQSNTDSVIGKETSIPFQYTKKLIVVEAHLNDSKKANNFIFDTGAFQSKVEYHLSEELNLETITTRNNGTAQGVKREIEITSVDSIRLSTSSFFNIGAGKLKYDALSYSPCIAEDGIIGANLIKLAHWKIDYEKKEMKVSKKPFVVNLNNQHYMLDFATSFLSGVPKVNVELEGKVIENVIFDLGYNGGLVVPYKFANQFHSENSQTLIDQSTAGIFGSNRDTLLVKELNVKLGNFQTKIPVEFSSLNKALLGNDFLEHFTIYLDYEDDKITLIPNSSVKIDKIKTFIPGILNDSLWIVNRTNPKLPLKIGDTLKTINGYKPKDLFESHCDYFLKISEFLKAETLNIVANNGNKINLK
jgi:predicted aspartyl protease